MSLPLERPETLAMVWPSEGEPPPGFEVGSYAARLAHDRGAFEGVQAASGWRVTEAQWAELMGEMVAGSMVFVEQGGVPVAAACALVRAGGWIELAWVAVVVEHRGEGLGAMVCSALTRRLLEQGETRLFGSTQDERLSALSIYLKLGFHPVYRSEKVERWRAVCEALGRPFEPHTWGWPSG